MAIGIACGRFAWRLVAALTAGVSRRMGAPPQTWRGAPGARRLESIEQAADRLVVLPQQAGRGVRVLHGDGARALACPVSRHVDDDLVKAAERAAPAVGVPSHHQPPPPHISHSVYEPPGALVSCSSPPTCSVT